MHLLHRRMTSWQLLACLSLLLFAIPAAAKTVVDFDPNVNFSKFKTFAFLGGTEQLNTLQVNPDLIKNRIHRMTSSELVKRGLVEVQPSENPDLVIRYWASGQQNLTTGVDTNLVVFQPYIGSYWGFTYNTVSAYSSRTGSLQIDLIDQKSKDLAWRLYLIRKITNSDKLWKQVANEITKGFESFPPSAQEVKDKIKEREEHPPKND
jgi:Domain of unknown function (DUF4136)